MKKSIATLVSHAFIFVMLLCLPACIHKKQIDKRKLHIPPHHTQHSQCPKANPPITIWVHGTLMFRKPTYHHIFNDKSYLMPIALFPENHHFRALAETITHHDPEEFPLEEFYIFSWSGRLQNQERKDAAYTLYQEIVSLTESYENKYGHHPAIRIIAHSHGGNVVLNMAKLKNITKKIAVKSLILLACPVQERTMHLINTPLFERVYSLYSSLDMIQILAPQFKRTTFTTAYEGKFRHHYSIPPFSSRLFPHYNHLTQAKIKINDYPISHTSFSTKEFTALLPTILNKLDEWHNESKESNRQDKYKLLCIYKPKKSIVDKLNIFGRLRRR